ncbi:hypothetical protein GOP47_0019146 [Adiantum capillus-veneris]|uniref:Uncharacterized protein n=1 Tax=Adiantum capillus-veneris TaxID=13818 RepID=A0A9D4UF42_ADICA|nr:hypothetical protein GOP47_0019146 [Adiantum capillus-veneris]
MDCIPVDGAFTDEGYSCDDSTIFDLSPYTRSIRSGCPDEARNAKEGNQALESFDVREDSCRETYHKYNACDPSYDACQLTSSLPLATDADDCEQSDDAHDAYSKYNVVFVDDQPLSHDEEASDRGSSQPAFMYRDVDIHDVGSSQTPSVDTFADDKAHWGFDLPVVEMDADMTSYVEKASERLRNF